jgi:hypothetical protein
MAIKFLDNIDLESNEIQDVAVENLSSDPTGFAGRIIFNTTTNTLKYYNGSAWVSLDGTGNVDSVTGSNGLKNAGNTVDVDIEPDYTTASNIILAAGSNGAAPVAAGQVLVSGATSGTTAKYVSITQLASTINGLLSGVTFEADSGTPIVVEDGDTVDFAGGSYITTLVTTGAVGIAHDVTTRTDTTSTAAPVAGGTFTAVDSVSSNSTGHVTAINLKTVTLPIAGTMSSFDVSGNGTGSVTQTISDGNTLAINGDGVYIDTFGINTDVLRISHILSGVTAAAYAYPTSVTVNAAGHITAITAGSAPGTMDSWTLNYGATGSTTTATISDGDSVTMRIYQSAYKGLFLQNPSANVQNVGLDLTLVDTVTSIDATNDFLTVAVTDATSGSGNNAKILASNISLSQFGVPTADLSMGTNKVTNVVDPTNAQDAATKQYVDDSVVGGLVYQGGYNASTNTPALSGASNIALTKGWVYTVTVAGTFIGTAVEIGDVIIVETDIAANSNPPVTDFTIVQRNVDLATNTVAGIASFPTANGFATMTGGAAILSAGAAVTALGSASETVTITTDAFGKVTAASEQNIAITASQVSNFTTQVETVIQATEFKANIGNGSATSFAITHNLGTRDCMVEVYDNTSYDTVMTKVVRTTTNSVTVSVATAPATNGLRVLIKSLQ